MTVSSFLTGTSNRPVALPTAAALDWLLPNFQTVPDPLTSCFCCAAAVLQMQSVRARLTAPKITGLRIRHLVPFGRQTLLWQKIFVARQRVTREGLSVDPPRTQVNKLVLQRSLGLPPGRRGLRRP